MNPQFVDVPRCIWYKFIFLVPYILICGMDGAKLCALWNKIINFVPCLPKYVDAHAT